MIDYIRGKLTDKNPTYAVIETAGIGYLLNISLNTYSALCQTGEECRLFTHLAVKSEATTPVGMVLYGFHSPEERTMFLNLISVSGVGANTARLILSSLTVDEAMAAIVNGQPAVFEKVKGIGSKIAQKLIIDLKGKYSRASVTQDFLLPKYNTLKEEALSALIMLGFIRSVAEKALDRALKAGPGNMTVEELIKQALKML